MTIKETIIKHLEERGWRYYGKDDHYYQDDHVHPDGPKYIKSKFCIKLLDEDLELAEEKYVAHTEYQTDQDEYVVINRISYADPKLFEMINL